MPMFRRKGIVQARCLKKDLAEDIAQWCGGLLVTEIDAETDETFVGINVPTREGMARASQNDWIVQGEQGDFWPVPAGQFEAIYEPSDA